MKILKLRLYKSKLNKYVKTGNDQKYIVILK